MTEEQNQSQNQNQDKREEIKELIIKLDLIANYFYLFSGYGDWEGDPQPDHSRGGFGEGTQSPIYEGL